MENGTETLAYATPDVRAPRTAPLAVIMLTGLGLIVLAGCFLKGVMGVIYPTISPFQSESSTRLSMQLTWPRIVFISSGFIFAAGCFVGAIILLFIGTRGLLRSSRTHKP